MGLSEQILGWFKPTSIDPTGVAIEAQIQLPRADLRTFAAIGRMCEKSGIRGLMQMNMAGLISADLEGSRRAMAAFYDRITSGEFCARECVSQFRRGVYKGRYKALAQSFSDDLATFMDKPDASKPIAL